MSKDPETNTKKLNKMELGVYDNMPKVTNVWVNYPIAW